MKIEEYRANDITRLSKSTFLTKTYLHDPNFYLEIYQAPFWNAKTFYLLQRRCTIVNPLKYCCNNVCPKNLGPPCRSLLSNILQKIDLVVHLQFKLLVTLHRKHIFEVAI